MFGIGLGAAMPVLGEAWGVGSMILTGVAARLLVGHILPLQARELAQLRRASAPADAATKRGLHLLGS
jgi:hypothetical protein